MELEGKRNFSGIISQSFEIAAATPEIRLTAEPEQPRPGETVTVQAGVSLPGAAQAENLPVAALSWRVGDQPAQNLTGDSFTVPETTADGTEIIITAVTQAGGNYLTASQEHRLTVQDCSHDHERTWGYDAEGHWEICGNCTAQLEKSGHGGGTANCHERAVCSTCDQPYGAIDADHHEGGEEVRNASQAGEGVEGYTGDTWCLGCNTQIGDGEAIPAYYRIRVEEAVNGRVTVSAETAVKDQEVSLTIEAAEGYQYMSLTVTDADGKEVATEEKTTGICSFRMPESSVDVTVVFRKKDTGISKPWIFTDIEEDPNNWKYQNVRYVYDRDLMGAVGATTLFQPDHPLTREMFVTVLYRMEDKPAVTFRNDFSDVKADQYYSDPVIWAKNQKIIEGFSDGTFGVGVPITREQIAKMLFLYGEFKGYDMKERGNIEAFTDRKEVNVWAVEFIRWANATGMITGKPNDTEGTSYRIDPKGNATRAECAKMLAMFLQKYDAG